MPKGVYQHKKGRTPWNKGKHHTEETKRKISESHKGKIGYWKGKNFTLEHRRKIGEANKISMKGKHTYPKTEFKKGHFAYNKGKKAPKEVGEKISKAKKGEKHLPQQGFQKGENNCNWRCGTSFEPYTIDWTKSLRRSIRKRDNYTCQRCYRTQTEELKKIKRKLSIHHIDYDKNNCNHKNLVTLCLSCHLKTNYNRDYWIKFFKREKKGGEKCKTRLKRQ